ncbi:MAG: Mfa1 family fimbria major subunit [Muribaculaceae bacterium]|nr:Mfa1 family fimbria major subunit [Muribaculaceae bacterium]
MKTYSKFLWGLAALPMLVSCSQDEVSPDPGREDTGAGVYMSFDLSFSGKNSRAFTQGDDSSSDGTEIGTDAENKVNEVLVVLSNPTNNGFVAYTLIPEEKLLSMTAGDQPLYRATGKFNKTVINDYYTTTTQRDVNVYVFCNPSGTFVQYIKARLTNDRDWINYTEDVVVGAPSENSLWNKNSGFFMSNLRVATRTLPAQIDDWNVFMSESTPFDLSGINNAGQPTEVDNHTNRGAIDVHRLAARFDIRDGSQMLDVEGCNGVKDVPFTYNVVFNKENRPLVQCEIISMAPVNMMNKQYVLERVSDTGMDTNIQLLGAERPWYSTSTGTVIPNSGNYVVTPYATEKEAGIMSNWTEYFNYTFYDPATGKVDSRGKHWKFESISKVVNGSTEDYPYDRYPDPNKNGDYRAWRYVTENTMPGSADNQMTGQTTGIVFEARMKANPDLATSADKWERKLYEVLNATVHNSNPYADPILFALSGSLYASWQHVQAAALAAAGFDATKGQNQSLDRTAGLYLACYGNGGVGVVRDDDGDIIFTDTEEPDVASVNYAYEIWEAAGRPAPDGTHPQFATFRDRAVTNLFTLYLSNQNENGDWGYYCYYYYWNRHNDNGQVGTMGPMEFAVVRNNVYKLAVTRLSQLGHPRVPENDPDTPTPDTPDEQANVYMTVSVRVLPWVVRINNIQF